MNKFILFLIALLFLSFPALAFSDDFDDGDISDWTLSWGSTTLTNIGTYNGGYSVVSPSFGMAPVSMSHTISGTVNYFSAIIKPPYKQSGVDACGGVMIGNATSVLPYGSESGCIAGSNIMGFGRNTAGTITGYGFSYSYYTPVTWIRAEYTVSGTNVIVKVYNASNGLLLNTATTPITLSISPTTLYLFGSGSNWYPHTAYFDDVVVLPNNLRGYVTSNVTGAPISGATVTIQSVATSTTDINGYWEAFMLVDGTYSYSISKDGYTTLEGSRYFSAS